MPSSWPTLSRAGALALALLASACPAPTQPTDVASTDAVTAVETSTDAPAPPPDVDTGAPADAPAPPPPDAPPPGDGGLVAERPYTSRAPRDYDAARAWPLIVLLHGYSASGAQQDLYFGLSRLVDSRGFLYAYPDGTRDGLGNRFWNATDACCNFAPPMVDDVAYITAIIDDMSARYNVDPRRIFLVGHSNGGFMSHRMACDRADRIAAIVSLAGATWADPARCMPAGRVAVLQVHGENDATIRYPGGRMLNGATYPGAVATVADWAMRNGCGPLMDTGMTLDLESTLPGAETRVSRHNGCMAGGAAELWTIVAGSHIPTFQPTWAGLLVDWLYAHPRP